MPHKSLGVPYESMTRGRAAHVQDEPTPGLLGGGGGSKQKGQAELEEEQCQQHGGSGPARVERSH